MKKTKRILMSRPTFFNISYEINPWMDLNNQINPRRAQEQWRQIYDIYTKKLGWQVDLIEPQPDLPDMVFTANGGLVIGRKAMVATFRHPERQPESAFFKRWFEDQNLEIISNRHDFEGEGDALLWNEYLLLGYPWRSDRAGHTAVGDCFGKKVVSLQLVDARFYHLDTCLTPLDEQTVALYAPAFKASSLRQLKKIVPRLILTTKNDAVAYGLNAFSDGRNVVISDQAQGLIMQYKKMGFKVWPTPISEFKKSGGGVKCLTLELH